MGKHQAIRNAPNSMAQGLPTVEKHRPCVIWCFSIEHPEMAL